MFGYVLDLCREGDVVPGHVALDVVGGHTFLIELHLHRARREVDAGHDIFQLLVLQFLYGLVAQFVVAYGTDGIGWKAKLTGVIGEICGCSTQLSAFWKAVP